MSNILVMPGTKWQEKLVCKLNKLGHKVYLVDPNPECVCHRYAYMHLVSDVFDITKIREFIKAGRIEAIMSDECDIVTPVIVKLAEEFNLCSIGSEMAALYTDKYKMREFCRNHNLSYPEYRLCETIDEAFGFFDEMNCKLIIKPLDCNSSKGVFSIESRDDLKEHFEESLSFSRVKKGVILERYISGTEFTVDGLKTPDSYEVLAISKKNHFKHNENIANELYFSQSDDCFDYDLLRETNKEFVKLSGLPYGFTHAEYKYENGVFYLIEIAARGGGNQISAIITQFLSDIDTYSLLTEWSLGRKVRLNFSKGESTSERCAVLKFFETPLSGGVVEKIAGEDILINDGRIRDYSFNFKIGDTIKPCISDSARVGYYVACCDSRQELDELMQMIEEKVKITVKQ